MSAAMTNKKDSGIKDKLIRQEICGHTTDIVCQNFSDRLFIIISQYEKIGSLIEVRRDVALDQNYQNHAVTYTTKMLLGQDVPLHHVIARSLASRIDTDKTIVLGLALRDTTRDATKQIEDIVLANPVWR